MVWCFGVDRMVAEGLEFDHNFDITCATEFVTDFKVAGKFTRGIDEVARLNDVNFAKTLQLSDQKGGQIDETRVCGFARQIGMQGRQFLRL